MKKVYSIIVPVYNRPEEIKELLESLQTQTFKQFEVLIIEDGSTIKCDEICDEFKTKLDLKYFFKENTGQGFSRNYGFERARGNFYIVFDSDVVVPANYLEVVNQAITTQKIDAFGGPDAASPDFSTFQKAVSYAMTSFFTTGGIRSKKNNAGGSFQPRSFNMGISKQVFEKTGGYAQRDKGEDIELSIRILKAGFKVELIQEAFVYHKRRGNLKDFFKQVYSFGQTRIILAKKHQGMLKAVHFFPLLFVGFGILSLISLCFGKTILLIFPACYLAYFLLIFVDAAISNKNMVVGYKSILASFVQLNGYGLGFASELLYKYFPSFR